jgi:hypothetical protein
MERRNISEYFFRKIEGEKDLRGEYYKKRR